MKKIKKVTKLETSDGKLFDAEPEARKHQEEVDEWEKNRSFLPWEYCECGCHGHELQIGDRWFWTTSADCKWSKTGRRHFLGEGHGYASSKRIGEYDSDREADEALIPIIKTILKESQESVEKLTEIVKDR